MMELRARSSFPILSPTISHSSSSIRHYSTVTAMSIGQPGNDVFLKFWRGEYGGFLIGTIDWERPLVPKQVLSIIIVNNSRLGYTLMSNVKVLRNFSTSIKLWFYFLFSKGLMLGIRERAASRQVQHMASVTFNGSKPITESIAIVSFFFLSSSLMDVPLVLGFFIHDHTLFDRSK